MEIRCPYCGSDQLYTDKKGYSLKKGITGMLLTGGVGLLAGLFGSNKVIITCLSCGKKFNPGDATSKSVAQKVIENYEPKSYQSGFPETTIHLKSAPPPKVNQRSKCQNCGNINDLGVKYCRCCGNKINYDSLEVIRNGQTFEYVYCPECEHKTPKPSKKCRYCTNCGKEFL